jgi:hypothetical protein
MFSVIERISPHNTARDDAMTWGRALVLIMQHTVRLKREKEPMSASINPTMPLVFSALHAMQIMLAKPFSTFLQIVYIFLQLMFKIVFPADHPQYGNIESDRPKPGPSTAVWCLQCHGDLASDDRSF